MERLYLRNLLSWLEKPKRKPLIMRGARQVGKTWLVRQLAKKSGMELIELNFEKNPELIKLFNTNDVKQILRLLETSTFWGKRIIPGKHLLFLDEIQVYPELLAKLRWFAEDMPELAVIAAGSLLEFVLAKHEFSMPVGRIEYFYIEPMSFIEFLLALGHAQLVDFLQQYRLNINMPDLLHQQLNDLFRQYIHVGGMPEAVSTWIEQDSLIEVNKIQHNLINTYRDDFAKYAGRIDIQRLDEILRAIPSLLGKKFKYSQVNQHIQAQSLKNALSLLEKAQLCTLVKQSAATGLPLNTHDKQRGFKVILVDIGLVNSLQGFTWDAKQDIEQVILNNEGAIAEQVAGQLLLRLLPDYQEPKLYYWLREDSSSNAEIDYVIQYHNKIIPIEVKAGHTVTLRSLHNFVHLRKTPLAVRFNTDLPSLTAVNTLLYNREQVQYSLLSIPLYLIECLPNLLAEAD